MLNIVIVQNVVPNYSCAFFNKLSKFLSEKANIYIIANYEDKSILNQSDNFDHFVKVNYKPLCFKNLIFESGLGSVILKCKPDIVIFSCNTRSILSIPLMLYLKFRGVKVFSWGMFHRIGPSKLTSNILFWLYAVLSEKALCYSKTGARHLLSMCLPPDKIKIIGTAIDESKPIHESNSINEKSLNAIRLKYNLNNNKTVLQVVRLSSIKKPLLTIEVAKILVSEDPEYKFILIGEGELKETIENLILKYNLKNNVFLLGSIYSESELALYFKTASVFVMPTCIGLSAHHAMSYSLPIVTDDSIAYQASEFDILSPGLNSLTYRQGDLRDFSNKIKYLCENDIFRNNLSLNALATVKINSLDNKVNNFIDSLLGK